MQSLRTRGTGSFIGARMGCAVALWTVIACSAIAQIAPTSRTNGVAGGINSSSHWGQLDGISQTYTFSSTSPVPEPPSSGLAMVGAALALVYWWRRDSRD